jgi:hypothetical protein
MTNTMIRKDITKFVADLMFTAPWDDYEECVMVVKKAFSLLAASGFVIVPREETSAIKRAFIDMDVIEAGAWSYLLSAALKETP